MENPYQTLIKDTMSAIEQTKESEIDNIFKLILIETLSTKLLLLSFLSDEFQKTTE